MKPHRIILVRHGQSEGNVNKSIYKEKPDYSVHLTDVGRKQAHDVGKSLSELMRNETAKFYVSPFWRTRETYLEIVKWFDPKLLELTYEDPRLREQEWGHKGGQSYNMDYEKERDEYGYFYWRFPNGESCADVFDRVSGFMNTLFRDFKKSNFPQNVIIVGHGMTNRLFLMRWFHYTVERFERIKNPKNCDCYVLEKQNGGKYKLLTDLPDHAIKHPYQFPEYTTLPKE